MFHPVAMPMERGWVGRVEDAEVVHLAAQTLQHLFTGGGKARDHARYPLADVTLLSPVAVPPSIRVFDEDAAFEFANPAALVGPAMAPGIGVEAGTAAAGHALDHDPGIGGAVAERCRVRRRGGGEPRRDHRDQAEHLGAHHDTIS